MSLKLSDKKQIVQEINNEACVALSVITAEYRGLTANQLTQIRSNARGAGVKLRIVPNTLANRAFVGTEYECMSEKLVGPILLAFSKEDPGAAARIFKAFIREDEKLIVTGIALGGKLLPANQLDVVASLPTKQQAYGLLAVVCKAPITKFARTLREPYAKLARIIAAVRDKKQG